MEAKSRVYQIVFIGVMAAVICILGPLSIPIGVVPITLTNLAIYLTLYILGMKKGTISYLVYMLLGFVGLPVFSGFAGGPAKLLGPTGGYIFGFIFMALIAGYFIDRFIDRWYLCFAGMILGTAICYAFGTMWLSYQAGISLKAALGVGVIPFIPADLGKVLLAAILGPQFRMRLVKAKIT